MCTNAAGCSPICTSCLWSLPRSSAHGVQVHGYSEANVSNTERLQHCLCASNKWHRVCDCVEDAATLSQLGFCICHCLVERGGAPCRCHGVDERVNLEPGSLRSAAILICCAPLVDTPCFRLYTLIRLSLTLVQILLSLPLFRSGLLFVPFPAKSLNWLSLM